MPTIGLHISFKKQMAKPINGKDSLGAEPAR